MSTAQTATADRPSFSVVIPAHDEQTVIGRCLSEFVGDLDDGEAEVVVVANGCSDATAEIARGFRGVRVVELAKAGKTAALNAGDGSVTAFPRIYLDADVVVGAAALRALAQTLDTDRALAAAPAVRFATEGRPWPVRAFYRTYEAMPYLGEQMIGTGIYAMSAAGRGRFGQFPAITADDLFVQRQFTPAERVVLSAHSFTVTTPRDTASLLKVRTRVAYGNAELAVTDPGDGELARSTGTSLSALTGLVRREPRRLAEVGAYAALTVAARARARRRSAATWQRDSSSR